MMSNFGQTVDGDPPSKFDALRPAFQGYFLLVLHIYVTMGLCRTISELRAIFAKFSYPLYLTPPLRGFSVKFFNGGGPEKRVLCPTRQSKSATICSFD